jgi:hypothetical protein
MSAPRCLSWIVLASLAAPTFAQGEGSTSAWSGYAPPAFATTSAYALAQPLSFEVEPNPEWMRDVDSWADELRARRAPVSRAAVDGLGGPVPIAFEDLPGGVLLGLVARPEFTLVEPRIRMASGRLEVTDGARAYPLPAADEAFLRACLAFASSERVDQAAIDIRSTGAIHLAPEFVDTPTGLDLIRCDGVPHRRRPDRLWAKSLIVDRAARLVLDPETGEARPEAELEVRFYTAAWSLPGARCLERAAAEGALRAELADCERIAAWVAFFRWARSVDPDGVARLENELAGDQLALTGILTPRRVSLEERVTFRPGRKPSEVADWMQRHRERVSK